MTDDDKNSKLNKVDLMSEETDGGTITRKHAKLEGKESTKELLSMADGWMKGDTIDITDINPIWKRVEGPKEKTKKCPNCSGGIMEVANERNWYCPACGNTPVFEEGEP